MNKIVKQVATTLNSNSSTILTGLGVAGVFTTLALGISETPKAIRLMDDYKKENKLEKLTMKETIKVTWKCYVPAAASLVVTSACIIGAQKVNLRRNAALAGIYSLTETAFKEYKDKVVETIGSTKEREIKDEIAKDRIENDSYKGKEVIITGKGNMLCYLQFSGRYFESDIEKIRQDINELGRDMLNNDFITLNDVYYALGLTGTDEGEMMVWNVNDGLIEVDFSAQLSDDNRPCIVIGFVNQPTYNHWDY